MICSPLFSSLSIDGPFVVLSKEFTRIAPCTMLAQWPHSCQKGFILHNGVLNIAVLPANLIKSFN